MNFKKLKTLDSSYFIGKSYFGEDGEESYLVFQPIGRYFRIINTKYILSWKSKGLTDETITPYATSDNSLTPLIDHYGSEVRVKFNRGCLKQPNKLTYDYGHRVNVYILYELGTSGSNNNDHTLKNCVYLVPLFLQKTQILKNMDILVMELDLIVDQASDFLVVDLVKMY